MTTQSWREFAACRDHPTLHPDAWHCDLGDHHTETEAKKVCRTECPVRAECFAWAADAQGLHPLAIVAGSRLAGVKKAAKKLRKAS